MGGFIYTFYRRDELIHQPFHGEATIQRHESHTSIEGVGFGVARHLLEHHAFEAAFFGMLL